MSMIRDAVTSIRRRLGLAAPASGAGGTPLAARDEGLREEVEFWRGWFVSKGGEWPDDYRRRFDPTLPLQPELSRLADRLADRSTVDLLDVGAGPVTRLGKTLPDGRPLRLTPTDLLADAYNKLIDELGAPVPVRTQSVDAERLAARFGSGSFDIVHAQNCVDHMANALVAIDQMLAVLRPGGVLYLRHEENEGQRTGYATIHHWDFYRDDASGHFMIRRVGERPIDVTRHAGSLGTSTCYREGNRVVFELTKHATR